MREATRRQFKTECIVSGRKPRQSYDGGCPVRC
jgi:hypothetical protein